MTYTEHTTKVSTACEFQVSKDPELEFQTKKEFCSHLSRQRLCQNEKTPHMITNVSTKLVGRPGLSKSGLSQVLKLSEVQQSSALSQAVSLTGSLNRAIQSSKLMLRPKEE